MAVAEPFPFDDYRTKLGQLSEVARIAVSLAGVERLMPTGELVLTQEQHARLRSLVDDLWGQLRAGGGQGAAVSDGEPVAGPEDDIESVSTPGGAFAGDALMTAAAYVLRAWVSGEAADCALALAQGLDWVEELATRHIQHTEGQVSADDVAGSDLVASELDAIDADIVAFGEQSEGAIDDTRQRAVQLGEARRQTFVELMDAG